MKDININDMVIIHKAGDVIPEVVKPIVEERGDDFIPFKMIKNCPCCGSPLQRLEGEADYYCLNPNCEDKIVNKLIHFASKPAYDIISLGDKLVEEFYNRGYLRTIPDIFRLENHYDELITLPGFGPKSIDNLVEAINKSKNNNLDRLVFGLGIRHVGAKVSKIICQRYKNMDNLCHATFEELSNIPDIGEVIAQEIVNYFGIQENLDLINELKELGLNMEYEGITIKENYFTGKKCVLTGTLSSMGRTEAKKIIESFGGNLSDSVSKKTDILILGENPGSKYDKAKELGIYIMNEEEFLRRIEE